MKKKLLSVFLFATFIGFAQSVSINKIQYIEEGANIDKMRYFIKKNQDLLSKGNINCLQDSIVSMNWNTFNSAYENTYRVIFKYGANNNPDSSMLQLWNTNAFNNSASLHYTYNASNLAITEIQKQWFNNAWQYQLKHNFSYNGNYVLADSVYTWNNSNNTWNKSNVVIYTYDANNNVISSIFKIYNSTNSAWNNSTQTTFTYNLNNKVTNELNENWISNNWTNDFQLSYTYDANNNVSTLLREKWNGSIWNNDTYTINNYDSSNDKVSTVYQNWNASTSGWINFTKDLNTYNNAHYLTFSLNEIWAAPNSWLAGSKFYYYYNCSAVGLNEHHLQLMPVTVYPNPAIATINLQSTVNIKHVQIANITGKIALESNAISSIDISLLEAGVYSINAFDEKGNCIKPVKFIKN